MYRSGSRFGSFHLDEGDLVLLNHGGRSRLYFADALVEFVYFLEQSFIDLFLFLRVSAVFDDDDGLIETSTLEGFHSAVSGGGHGAADRV